MGDKIIIKNAHCKFFEGQTGLCKAKEFTKCNPVNCKLYTIDELSTILELQEKLQAKEQECEELRGRLNTICFDPRTNNNRCISYNRMAEDYEKDLKKIDKYKQALDEIEKFAKNDMKLKYNDKKNTIKRILNIINNTKENN